MSSKAAQLLLALNNQIRHSQQQDLPLNESSNSRETKPNVKNKKGINKSQLASEVIVEQEPVNRESQFNQEMKYEETHQTPEWLLDMLSKQIGPQISGKLSEMVQSILRQRQKSTYDSITGKHNNYLQSKLQISRKKDEFGTNAIDRLMAARTNKVEEELEMGNLEVIPDRKLISKKQVELLQKLDLERMIKIKDGELRSKLDILHEKMSNLEAVESWTGPTKEERQLQKQLDKKIAESVDASNFALDSQRTKIAREYVRYMNQQRKLFDKRKKQRQARYAEHDAERQNELNEALQMKDLAKRQQILQRIEERRKKRQEQEKELEAKDEEARNFLAEFHRKYPLFKQKQKQFIQKFVKPQEKLREERLNEIRENRKSMSLNEIKLHEQKYINKLHSERVKRAQQFKLILKSRRAQDQLHPYYRGSSHKRMEELTKQEQIRNYSLRQASKVKALRMKQYGQVINSKHKPNIDEEKKKQLLDVIEADFMRKQKAKKVYKQVIDETTKQVKLVQYYEPLPQRDFRSEGKKYFQVAKRRAKKKQSTTGEINDLEQEVKSPKSQQGSIALLQNSRTEPMGKQKSIWHVRAKQLEQYANAQIGNAKNFEYIKHNIENLDNKAAQKEDLMKHVELSMEDHMKQKGNLDKYYLKSIQQKMKLLE